MNFYKQRLLNVVRSLKECPRPSKFTMECIGHFCGTPACALGHYAARKDLQHTFSIRFFDGCLKAYGAKIGIYDTEVLTHFGITSHESEELFGIQGCADAQTPDEAIYYINRFIDHKWPEEKFDPAFKKFRETLTTEIIDT